MGGGGRGYRRPPHLPGVDIPPHSHHRSPTLNTIQWLLWLLRFHSISWGWWLRWRWVWYQFTVDSWPSVENNPSKKQCNRSYLLVLLTQVQGNTYCKLHKSIVPTFYADVFPSPLLQKHLCTKKASPCFQIQLQKMPELVKWSKPATQVIMWPKIILS